MSVRFYGHACLKLLPARGAAALLDPWFDREGAFFGTWFQFPENAPLMEEALGGAVDICVSHNHADHLDPATLRRACANASVRVHVPRYETGFLLQRVAKLMPEIAGRFVEHRAWERFAAGGSELYFVPEESPGSVDAAMVARIDGRTLVNLNDSRLSSAQLRRIRAESGPVEWLALQASGASEYPVCYTYSAADMSARRKRKRAEKFELCGKIIDVLEPRRILLFAGPPVFLRPEHAVFNTGGDDSVFPDSRDALKEMQASRPDITGRSYLVVPGEELDDRFLWPAADLRSPRLAPYARKDEYMAAYARRRADLPAFDDGEAPAEEAALRYFRRMATISAYISKSIAGEVTFRVRARAGEGAYTVDFASGTARRGASDAPLYVLTLPAACLTEILSGAKTWDDAFLSLRMTFDERTDRFLPHLKTLLRYMDPALFSAVESYEKHLSGADRDVAMFEVLCAGERWRVQRNCPHAGTDLDHHGRVAEDGTIVCLAHRFRFDVRTGECLNARGYRLKTEPLP